MNDQQAPNNPSSKGKKKVVDEDKAVIDNDDETDGVIDESDTDSDCFDNSYDYLSARDEKLMKIRTSKTNGCKNKNTPISDMCDILGSSRARNAGKSEALVEHEEFLNGLLK